MTVIQVSWLLVTALLVLLMARRLNIPYPTALVVAGLGLGFANTLPGVHMSSRILLTVFLPPLLFEAAINMSAEELRKDWVPIAIYSILGTVASTYIVGYLLSFLSHLPLRSCLIFGALISPTDPISVITLFKKAGVSRRLTLIADAESLFNDAVGAVLFTVLIISPRMEIGGLGLALVQLLKLAGGGVLLGCAIGWIATRIHHELDDRLVETTLTMAVAFGAYLAADAIGVSGVTAVVSAGLVIGNVGVAKSMSESTRVSVSTVWEFAAFLANAIVFLLIGITVAGLNWRHHYGLVAFAIAAVFVGRAIIYPASSAANLVGAEIPRAWQHALYWGGLRGALSMALVLSLSVTFPLRDILVAATFGVVLFSLLVQGCTLGPLLRHLQVVND